MTLHHSQINTFLTLPFPKSRPHPLPVKDLGKASPQIFETQNKRLALINRENIKKNHFLKKIVNILPLISIIKVSPITLLLRNVGFKKRNRNKQ